MSVTLVSKFEQINYLLNGIIYKLLLSILKEWNKWRYKESTNTSTAIELKILNKGEEEEINSNNAVKNLEGKNDEEELDDDKEMPVEVEINIIKLVFNS